MSSSFEVSHLFSAVIRHNINRNSDEQIDEFASSPGYSPVSALFQLPPIFHDSTSGNNAYEAAGFVERIDPSVPHREKNKNIDSA